jgi:hypothetical protein
MTALKRKITRHQVERAATGHQEATAVSTFFFPDGYFLIVIRGEKDGSSWWIHTRNSRSVKKRELATENDYKISKRKTIP